MKITHYLYNAYLIEFEDKKIAIDPGQNLYLFNLKSLIPEEEWASITHILITHGDPDHHWNSDRVANASNAPVICGKGLTKKENGTTLVIDPRGKALTSWIAFSNLHPLSVGETAKINGVTIKALKTIHGPIDIPVLGFHIRKQPGPGERTGLGAAGFHVTMGDKSFVNLGDTLLQNSWNGLEPDVLMLPIGGRGNNIWTMDVADAIAAVKSVKPKVVIPCHYNVPLILNKKFAPADDIFFKNEVEKLGCRCEIMKYGNSIQI